MTKRTNFRWVILSLLFFATTINYIDRRVIGLLKPYIGTDLGWSEADYGYIVSAFQIAYGVGLLLSGTLLDRFGTRWGYTIAITVWSLGGIAGAMGGAVAASFVGLMLEITGSYIVVFACASSMYLLAWAVLKVFVPVITPLNLVEPNH